MRPLRFELASKRAERRSERGLILGVEPHKRMGSKPTGFAAPVLSLLCTRRLHNCRGRTGERHLKATGYLKVRFMATCKVKIIFFIL